MSDAPGGRSKNLAVFQTGDAAGEVRVDWQELGLTGPCTVRNLWTHADEGRVAEGRGFTLPAHGSGLYRITPVR